MVYAVVSLTVVRMVPVAIALLGSGQGRTTTAFIGWFGPRGLASVVFALLAVEELGGADPRVVAAVNTIAITILLSVVAHGVTARPLATRYVGAPSGHSTSTGPPVTTAAQRVTRAITPRVMTTRHPSPSTPCTSWTSLVVEAPDAATGTSPHPRSPDVVAAP